MQDDVSGWTEWNHHFSKIADLSGASELHGLLTGIVVAAEPPTAEEWQAILARIGVDLLPADALRVLTEEAEDVAELLNEDTMDYAALLPDDDHPLAERIDALAKWCGGVLLGFGLTGAQVRGDEDEIIHGLSDVAALEYSDDDDDEEGEESYADLVEFVRLIPVSLGMGRKRLPVAQTALLSGMAMTAPSDLDYDAYDIGTDHDQDSNTEHQVDAEHPEVVQHFNPARPS